MFSMQFAPVISLRSAQIIFPTRKIGKRSYRELIDWAEFSFSPSLYVMSLNRQHFFMGSPNATRPFSQGEFWLENLNPFTCGIKIVLQRTEK